MGSFGVLGAMMQSTYRRPIEGGYVKLYPNDVWGYSDEVFTRTVDTHIGELGKKLEDDPVHPKYILTVRKAGYRLRRD